MPYYDIYVQDPDYGTRLQVPNCPRNPNFDHQRNSGSSLFHYMNGQTSCFGLHFFQRFIEFYRCLFAGGLKCRITQGYPRDFNLYLSHRASFDRLTLPKRVQNHNLVRLKKLNNGRVMGRVGNACT